MLMYSFPARERPVPCISLSYVTTKINVLMIYLQHKHDNDYHNVLIYNHAL